MKNQVEIKAIFGQALQQARKDKQISQERLALEADVDRSYISKLERGAFQPCLSIIFAVSDVLEIPASELIARVEERLENKAN